MHIENYLNSHRLGDIKPTELIFESAFLENTSLVKFIRNHIWVSGGVFSKSSQIKISMISMTSSLSLKLYINLLVYDRNTFGSPSKFFSNLQKLSKNNWQCSGDLRTSFEESSEILGKWSDIFGKSSKTPSSVCHTHS